MNAKLIKCLGTDDSVNTCDCCGRNKLKETVAFETEEGGTVWMGVVCAARARGIMAADIRCEARNANQAKADAKAAAQRAEWDARHARWIAHLVALTGGIREWSGSTNWSVGLMLQAAGGYAKASETFQG